MHGSSCTGQMGWAHGQGFLGRQRALRERVDGWSRPSAYGISSLKPSFPSAQRHSSHGVASECSQLGLGPEDPVLWAPPPGGPAGLSSPPSSPQAPVQPLSGVRSSECSYQLLPPIEPCQAQNLPESMLPTLNPPPGTGTGDSGQLRALRVA